MKARLELEFATSPHRASRSDPAGISVNEVLLAYLSHAEGHYRGPDGESTGEVERVKAALRYARELYGTTAVAEFGPIALRAVRQKYIELGWCRKSVNQQTDRVRRAFKWAAEEELIPFEAYHRLTAVSGLRRGRTEAHEREPIGPVEDSVVDATLPQLNRHVRGLVEFQRLTGCRPGEACRLRRSVDPRLGKLSRQYLEHPHTEDRRKELAKKLGVSALTLTAMDVGWTGSAWSVPEHNHLRRVVGIAYRATDGRKWFEGGGRRGLIIPNDVGDHGPIHICEGASDTAALLSVGVYAIGRPMAKTPTLVARWLREYLSGPVGGRLIVVVGDRDSAGIDGAENDGAGGPSSVFQGCCWSMLPPNSPSHFLRPVRGAQYTRDGLGGDLRPTPGPARRLRHLRGPGGRHPGTRRAVSDRPVHPVVRPAA